MKSIKKQRHLSSLAPLLLFVVFTTCVLSVLLTGADTYKRISQRDQDSFQHRTVAQYLTTRIRQSDIRGMVMAGDFSTDPASDASSCQGDTLILQETIDGKVYYTRIYCHDGYLQELFSPAGIDFSPSAGDKILKADSLFFTKNQNLLTIYITYADASTETLLLHLRSGEEVSS